MSEHVISANNILRIVCARTDAIGVAVSFGKDSLATLDLACRLFRRVEGYYLYRVRGLEIVDAWADAVKKRHGVAVRMYPHFDLTRVYRNAVCQPHWRGLHKAPRITMADIEAKFRVDADIDWIAYGWRRNDSFSRALIMKQTGGIDWKTRRVFPLRSWSRSKVYDYLDAHDIPRPPTLGRKEQGGLDFHEEAIAALRETSPRDYRRFLVDFPFALAREVRARSRSQ